MNSFPSHLKDVKSSFWDYAALIFSKAGVILLALAVRRLAEDDNLRNKLAANVKMLAQKLWGETEVKDSLAQIFADDYKR